MLLVHCHQVVRWTYSFEQYSELGEVWFNCSSQAMLIIVSFQESLLGSGNLPECGEDGVVILLSVLL